MGNSAHCLIVLWAAISCVNYHRRARKRPQLFQSMQQTRIDLQPPAAATFQFTS
jgi:hypothetical protein